MSFPNKKLFKTIQLLFFFSLLKLIQSRGYTEESMKADTSLGIGIGTLLLIIILIISGLLCIFGLSTTNPGLFLFLGIIIPAFFLFIFAIFPSKKTNDNSNSDEERNAYIIIRWVWFILFLLVLFIPILPLFSIWTTQVIPQRVDSRAQKLYDEKYLRNIEEEKKKEEEREEEEEDIQQLNLNDNRTGSMFDLPAANVRNNENRRKYAALRRRRNNVGNNNINNNNSGNYIIYFFFFFFVIFLFNNVNVKDIERDLVKFFR